MSDVFNGYQNLLNGTSNVVAHKWALELNIGLENLSFEIANIFIMLHSCCFKTSPYVQVAHVIFQQTNNHVQKQCFKVIAKVNFDELEK
jgi:hypothetical protein